MIMLPSHPLRADDCGDIKILREKENTQLNELIALGAELNQKFESQLNADLTSQSEGFLDEIHHNAAVKIAYARKKITQAITRKQIQVEDLTQQYCEVCSREIKGESRAYYCDACRKVPACASAPERPPASLPPNPAKKPRQR